MKEHKNKFLGFESDYNSSRAVLFGAGFDGTCSFKPGARFAPESMRMDSKYLETYSPYLDADLEDYSLFDAGDIEFPIGNTKGCLDEIYKMAKEIVSDNKIPIMIGGEHLVSLPAVMAVLEKYPDLILIHLDAHTDLRDSFFDNSLSHACVIKRIYDLIGDNRIYQFGIRSGLKEEFEFAKNHTNLTAFTLDGTENLYDKLKDLPCYITIDLDVLDPAYMQGTGTLEAGGVTYRELQKAIMDFSKLNVVGADIVELCPLNDKSGASCATAIKVLRELTLSILK